MTDFDRTYPSSVRAGRAAVAVDAGLRAFMLGVYNKLALGLVLSAAVAWLAFCAGYLMLEWSEAVRVYAAA